MRKEKHGSSESKLQKALQLSTVIRTLGMPWLSYPRHLDNLDNWILKEGVVIPLIFPSVPQSSQTESLEFPRVPPPKPLDTPEEPYNLIQTPRPDARAEANARRNSSNSPEKRLIESANQNSEVTDQTSGDSFFLLQNLEILPTNNTCANKTTQRHSRGQLLILVKGCDG